MRLLSTVLQMPVIIPPQPSAAVVLGAAFLGKFAHDLAEYRQGKPIVTQEDSADAAKVGDKLWDVMTAMTQPATRVEPRTGPLGEREKKLLDAKYEIFRDSIDVQRKWRQKVAEAVKKD